METYAGHFNGERFRVYSINFTGEGFRIGCTTITVGVTAESSVTPTIIVALSAYHALSPAVIDSESKQSLQEEEERP